MFGYTGNGLETGETIHGILTIGTLIPAVLVAVSLLLFTLFRLNRKKYEAIIRALSNFAKPARNLIQVNLKMCYSTGGLCDEVQIK